MKNFSFQEIREKFSNSLSENLLLRRVKNFFSHKVIPLVFKGFLSSLLLVAIVLIAIKIFRPIYLDKLYQKTHFYFLHYLNLDNHTFSEVKIIGNKRSKAADLEAIIFEVAKDFKQSELQNNDGNYEPLIKKIMLEIKNKSPWVNKIVINRSMPDLISIDITEYEPFAIWQDDDKKYVTDKDGNIVLVNDIEEFKHLVILSGKGANTHAKSLFNIFAIDPALSNRVYSATWLGGRRWDIRFDNGLLIKLPEDNISEAWRSLIKIYTMPGSINGLQVIDLRIEGKVYLEYGDSVIKELKSL